MTESSSPVSPGSPPHINQLPDEVMLHIFGNLPAEGLATAAKVNRQWYRLAGDETLWRALYQADFPESLPDDKALQKYRERQLHIKAFPNLVRTGDIKIRDPEKAVAKKIDMDEELVAGGVGYQGDFLFIRSGRDGVVLKAKISQGVYRPIQELENVAYCCFSSIGNFFITTSGKKDLNIFELKDGTYQLVRSIQVSTKSNNQSHIMKIAFKDMQLFVQMSDHTIKVLDFISPHWKKGVIRK